MNSTYLRTAIVFAALTVSGTASAQGVVTTKQISAEVANGIAMATIEQCRKDGFRVSVAIVDRAGNIQALLRDEGVGPHTPDTARRKAFTSASFGITTADFAARVAQPGNAALNDIAGVITLAGGIPVRAGSDLIGGIGVGGAPSGASDETCAKAGLEKFAGQLK